MMMKQVFCVAVLATLVGCAHGTMRGSVAMKASDNEAHVCMGDQEVKAGDRVALFKNECVSKGGGTEKGNRGGTSCKKVKLGEGIVERALNEHYSIVKVDPGVHFEEGTVVEKE